MSRNPTRISRGLIALLIVVALLGSFFYLHRPTKSVATSIAPRAAEPATQPATPLAMATDKPPAPVAMTTVYNAPSAIVSRTPKFPAGATSAAPTIAAFAASPTSRPAQVIAPTTAPVVGWDQAFAHSSNPVPASVKLTGNPMIDAAARASAGDLLGARSTYNEALQSGKLSPADTAAVKQKMSELNQTIVFSPKRYANDEFGGSHVVKPGEKLRAIADANEIPWEFLAKINNLADARKMRSGQTLKLIRGPFNVVVTKSAFTMDLYLGSPGEKGSVYVTSYPVGLGKDDSTPTGVWMVEVHNKIKNPTYFSPRGEGVIDANDPNNPLGHRWIGLSGIDGHAVGAKSYGIHGTIHPESVGRMKSMGCIRMKNEDVEQVFDLLTEGKSTVIVKD